MILLLDFIFFNKNFYITNNDADIEFSNHTYLASYIKVNNLNFNSNIEENKNTVSILVGVDSEIIRDIYAVSGFEKVKIKIFSYQNGEVFLIFNGIATSVIINENGIAEIKVSSNLESHIFPKEVISRACLNSLYDSNCGVIQNDFHSQYSVDQIIGNIIILKSNVSNPALYRYGFFKMNGMKRIIIDIVGKNVFLNERVYTTGEICFLYYGCNKTFSDCKNKFNNRNCIAFDTVPLVNPVAGNFI